MGAHKEGISRATLMRLMNVNKAMTATEAVHHVFNDYCQNSARKGKDYEETMWEDVEFLASEFGSQIGSSWTVVRQGRTFNQFSCRGMTRTTTGVAKMAETFDGLEEWLERLKSSNIIFDEPDIERVIDEHGHSQDHEEDLEVVCTGGADAGAAPRTHPAVTKWCKTHPTRNGETEEEQKEQVDTLVARRSRREVLWEKEQARLDDEEHEREKEAEAEAIRAVARAEREFIVEAIVNKREVNGKVEYRVQWQGYAASHNTWESAESLISARRVIATFEKKRKSRK